MADHNDLEGIRALLVGHRIVAVAQEESTWYAGSSGTMTLDDGTVLQVSANTGCGGCTSGWYAIKRMLTTDHVITNVTVSEADLTQPTASEDKVYKLFVYMDGIGALPVLEVVGEDGSGWYGTGYTISVKEPRATIES